MFQAPQMERHRRGRWKSPGTSLLEVVDKAEGGTNGRRGGGFFFLINWIWKPFGPDGNSMEFGV